MKGDFLNLALKEVQLCWREINQETFANCLKQPIFRLHSGKSRFGMWTPGERCISMSADFIMDEAWNKIITVIKHEMLHQYIDEVMKAEDTSPHGLLFKAMSKKFNIETYQEADIDVVENSPNSSVLERVRKLLSLASSSNVHEAETAMNKANLLILKWNLKLSRESENKLFIHKHLGKPGRIDMIKRTLSQILRDFFFVEVLWVQSYDVKMQKRGSVMEICGSRENVDIAEYVYHFLSNISEMYWKDYKKKNKASKRMHYIYGLLLGFYEKLEFQNSHQATEHGLIWKGDPELKKYFNRRHPRTRSVGSSSTRLHAESVEDGIETGKRVILSKGIKNQKNRNLLLR